jgi:hypothetical protein
MVAERRPPCKSEDQLEEAEDDEQADDEDDEDGPADDLEHGSAPARIVRGSR